MPKLSYKKEKSSRANLRAMFRSFSETEQLGESLGVKDIIREKREAKSKELEKKKRATLLDKIGKDLESKGYTKKDALVDEDGNVSYKYGAPKTQNEILEEKNELKRQSNQLRLQESQIDATDALAERRRATREDILSRAKEAGGKKDTGVTYSDWLTRVKKNKLTEAQTRELLADSYEAGVITDVQGRDIFNRLKNTKSFSPEEDLLLD